MTSPFKATAFARSATHPVWGTGHIRQLYSLAGGRVKGEASHAGFRVLPGLPACLSADGDKDTVLLTVVHATNPAQSARLCNFVSARFPILTNSTHLVADQALPRKWTLSHHKDETVP